MSGSGWFAWLEGLLAGWWEASPPPPGSHDAYLAESKIGAVLDKERRKPPGERDEELVHTLRVRYRRAQLANMQATAHKLAQAVSKFERPAGSHCCAANGWVRQRLAASNRARHDFCDQHIQQLEEELAAAEARRPAALVVQPTLRLDLPPELQHPPPRLDMCIKCARRIEQAEMRELHFMLRAEHLGQRYQGRGLQPASQGAAGDPPARDASQAWQQQCSAGSNGTADEPATPAQQQQQQQQLHTSEEEEQERRE